MTTQNEKAFNECAASKVIKFAEMKTKLEALYESELSLSEKIYLWTLNPISSLLASTSFAIDTMKGKQPAEIWRGEDNVAYVSAATFLAHKEYDLFFAFNKRICAKTWELGEKAFAECEDYQGSSTLQKARSVF